MRKPRGKLANLFSFNQHRKRFGAKSVANTINGVNLTELKKNIVDGDTPKINHGSKKELKAHIEDLRQEFSGQPEINYYHAQLIVLIRRGLDVPKHFADFEELWQSERDFLIGSLSIRWLISAADTLIDYSKDKLLQAILMNAVVLINTLKLQESERYLVHAEDLPIDKIRFESLQKERLSLFDGVSGFAVGTDDTLRNMRWRLDKICSSHPLGAIVIEIFERAQIEGNVYARFKSLHTRDKTAWWRD